MFRTYTLSNDNYDLLKQIDFTELGTSLVFNDETNSFSTDNIRLLEVIITEEIATKGMTRGQENCNEYGRRLYDLYDEIYYQ